MATEIELIGVGPRLTCTNLNVCFVGLHLLGHNLVDYNTGGSFKESFPLRSVIFAREHVAVWKISNLDYRLSAVRTLLERADIFASLR